MTKIYTTTPISLFQSETRPDKTFYGTFYESGRRSAASSPVPERVPQNRQMQFDGVGRGEIGLLLRQPTDQGLTKAKQSSASVVYKPLLFRPALGVSSIVGGLILAILQSPLAAQITPVTTYHNDLSISGLYSSETVLNPTNVSTETFGKIGVLPVDGQVYGEPLYVPGVNIPSLGTRNVVYIATEHDSVYAFDADVTPGGSPVQLWHATLINPEKGITTVPSSAVGASDISPEIGITSTPVIDLSTNTIFVAAKLVDTSTALAPTPVYFYLLAAFDLATGSAKFNSPKKIEGTFPGNCEFSLNGKNVVFDALHQLNRPGLALNNGSVVISFGSHGDTSSYTGWVFAYSATTLKQEAIWNDAPNTIGGDQQCRSGIWMSGAAPSIDANGNVYLSTGNGEFSASSGGNDYGDSIVKLTTLGTVDYFTPYNQSALEDSDQDVGAGGVLLLPDQPGQFPHLAVEGGKQGTIYVVNRDTLGGFSTDSSNPQAVQTLPNATSGIYGTPAYFNGMIYFGGVNAPLSSYSITNGLLSSSPVQTTLDSFGYPGPTPSISSNGETNAIIWAIDPSGYSSGGPSIVHAYNATNLASELWNSSYSGSRDTAGPAVKFSVPTIANGRVYVGAGGEVDVYGLLQ